MHRKKVFFKYGAFALLAMALFMVQYSKWGGEGLSLYGPDLFMSFTVAVAIFEGAEAGVGAGLLSAVLMSVCKGGSVFGYTLFYPIYGLFSGIVIERDFRKHFITAMIFSAAGCVLQRGLAYVFVGAFVKVPPAPYAVATAIKAAITLVFAAPVYFAVKGIDGIFSEEEE